MAEPVHQTAPGALRISFLAGIENDPYSMHRGLDLFTAADLFGYDAGYVRVRHLQPTISSPLTFLAAASQRTERIELGTGVIPLWFEKPARLAEDLATLDVLSNGRVRAGLSSGYSAKVAPYLGAYGASKESPRDRVDRILAELLRFVDGEIVANADHHVEDIEAGTALRIQPQSPGLRSRLAYGAASVERARWVGERGLGLQLATLAPDDRTGRTFEELQLEALRAYREASRDAGFGDGTVAVSRQAIPVASERELEMFQTLIPRERGAAAGVISEHRAKEIGGGSAVFSRVVLDSPDVVSEVLSADAVLREADELMLVLPFAGGPAEHQRVLELFAEEVVPALAPAS